MKLFYIFGIVKALLKKLAVPSNWGTNKAGRILGIGSDGEVTDLPAGEAGITDAGDVTYVKGTGYDDGSVGAAMEAAETDVSALKSEIVDLGLSVVDGALCQTYTA